MIPRQGSGIIDTGFPLLGSLSYDQSFRCPDALYPHSEATLQHHLAKILESFGGRVYSEVQLSAGTEAIDLVWYNPGDGDQDTERKVGIEVKRTDTVADASTQVEFYRDCTLGDARFRDQVYDGSQTWSVDDIYVLDAVWIATYAEPRPKYPSQPVNRNILKLVPEADGELRFHSHSGQLYYHITEPAERETLPSLQRGEIDNLVEPEANLVGKLWRDLTAEGYTVSAEAPYTPVTSDREIAERLRYGSRKQADLVVSPDPDAWQESSPPVLKAIEVKSKRGIKNDRVRDVIDQLRTYVSSELFSEVYLAVPCDVVPAEWLPGDSHLCRGYGGLRPLSQIIDAVPKVGVISICQPSIRSSTEQDTCEDDQIHVLDEKPARPETLTQRRIPTLIHTPDGDPRFEWTWYDEC
jgi:hypothetical protein